MTERREKDVYHGTDNVNVSHQLYSQDYDMYFFSLVSHIPEVFFSLCPNFISHLSGFKNPRLNESYF